MGELSSFVQYALNFHCKKIEEHFGSRVMSYVGQIDRSVQEAYIEAIESIAKEPFDPTDALGSKRIVILLTTPGGVAEAVEKMVEVTRHHFAEVYFVVPLSAMSAGTIFCMSGDKIFMDYTSSLGPIDPQVQNPDGHLVPALGYIDKVDELINKSQAGLISNAELMMLQRLDLATLRRYEQARDLSISLLKKWLVRYKFKDWVLHQTNNVGAPVTEDEKITRAEEIAMALSNNQKWHSHGRMIGVDTLTTELKLKIEDYSAMEDLRQSLRAYTQLLLEYMDHQQTNFTIHYRRS